MSTAIHKTIFSFIIMVYTCAGASAQANPEIARLRSENIRLRNRIAALEREVSRQSSRMSSLDGEYDGSGFYSLADRWDEFDDSGLDDGRVLPVSKVDTILCIPEDDVLNKYIDIYSTLRGRSMIRVLRRYDRHLPMIKKVFRKYGVPEDFAALAIVESAVNAKAVSHAGAVGMWQIMESTAKQYGMTVTFSKDDRYDIEKSTVVAARILRDAYKRFGDWGLAIMSYNCGPGRIQSVLTTTGDAPSYDILYRYVPRETREYLPALVAAMYVSANRTLLLPET